MKNLPLISILTIILFSPFIKSQEMTPPPPLEIPFFDMLDGDWVSEPYEFMGMTFTDEAEQDWKLNHQYFVIDYKSKSGNNEYKGKGYFTQDTEGNIKGWWFDIFGYGGLMTYTGKIEGNKMTIKGKNAVYSEEREVSVNGDTMLHNVNQSVTGEDGKTQEMKFTVTYKRKKK